VNYFLKHSVYYQNLLTEINELQKINRLCAFRILKQCKYKFINTFLKGFLALFFAFVLFRIQSDRWLLLVIMGTRYSVHRVLRDVKSIRIAFVDIGWCSCVATEAVRISYHGHQRNWLHIGTRQSA